MMSQQSTARRGKKAVCTRQMGVEPARAHKHGGLPRIVTQFQVTAKEKMRLPGHAARNPTWVRVPALPTGPRPPCGSTSVSPL